MKPFLLCLAAALLAAPLASARFSERQLESRMATASKSGKLLAFVFYQGYALPNCPTCVADTNAKNKALKSAIPRTDVVVIEIDADDKGLDKLPSAVGGGGSAPRIVVTDAAATEVLARLSGAPDRDQAAEFKKSVAEARNGG
jgi:hypothetical protein